MLHNESENDCLYSISFSLPNIKRVSPKYDRHGGVPERSNGTVLSAMESADPPTPWRKKQKICPAYIFYRVNQVDEHMRDHRMKIMRTKEDSRTTRARLNLRNQEDLGNWLILNNTIHTQRPGNVNCS